MASAYANPASPDYHSPKMLEGIERGLQYWYKGHPSRTTGGTTPSASRCCFRAPWCRWRMFCRPTCSAKALATTSLPTEVDPTYSRASLSYPQQQLIRGALARSAEDVAAASEAMQRIIRIRTDEGIQRDFSFHQHGPQLYNGGYGLTFMVDMMQLRHGPSRNPLRLRPRKADRCLPITCWRAAGT